MCCVMGWRGEISYRRTEQGERAELEQGLGRGGGKRKGKILKAGGDPPHRPGEASPRMVLWPPVPRTFISAELARDGQTWKKTVSSAK